MIDTIILIFQETIVRRSKSIKNQLRIINYITDNEKRDIIELYSNEDAQKWFEQLTICIQEHARWKHTVIIPQQVPNFEYLNENTNIKNFFNNTNKRQKSLYDETSLLDNICKEVNIFQSK